MKAFIGIDPGQTGSACLLTDEGLHFIDFKGATSASVVYTLLSWQREFTVELAVVEAVHSMPDQGVASTFAFGRSFGWCQGVLDALLLPWRLVPPQKWQAGLGADKSKGKAGLVEVAERLFPMADFRGPKGGTLSGRADAALIALWAKGIS